MQAQHGHRQQTRPQQRSCAHRTDSCRHPSAAPLTDPRRTGDAEGTGRREDHRHPSRAPRDRRSTRPVTPRGTPSPAPVSRRRSSTSRPTRASSASARATPWPGSTAYRELFLGTDPLATELQVRRIESIGFHAGRFWPLEAALLGHRRQGRRPAGGDAVRRRHRPRARLRVLVLRAAARAPGRGRRTGWSRRASAPSRSGPTRGGCDEGVAAVAAVREAVGDRLDIMVDLNQAWRMPGDVTEPLELADRPAGRAPPRRVRRRLGRGAAALRRRRRPPPAARRQPGRADRGGGDARLAAADPGASSRPTRWTSTRHDVVLALGHDRGPASSPRPPGRATARFTPHTWTNGLGLLANLHVAAGVGAGPVPGVPLRPGRRLDPGAPRLPARRAAAPRPRRHARRARGARARRRARLRAGPRDGRSRLRPPPEPGPPPTDRPTRHAEEESVTGTADRTDVHARLRRRRRRRRRSCPAPGRSSTSGSARWPACPRTSPRSARGGCSSSPTPACARPGWSTPSSTASPRRAGRRGVRRGAAATPPSPSSRTAPSTRAPWALDTVLARRGRVEPRRRQGRSRCSRRRPAPGPTAAG